jgi:hypothetical protein
MGEGGSSPVREPWDDAQTRHRMVLALLISLRDQGPMGDDQAARLCVSRQELAALMRDIDKLALSLAAADGLSEFLDDTGGVGSLAGALLDWRKHASIVRWSFKWETLAPAVRQRVQRRRDTVLGHTQQQGWVVRDGNEGLWTITETGKAAIDAAECGEGDDPDRDR